MKHKVVTNKTFEALINRSRRRHFRRTFEDRWSGLDLDDITADIDIPSESEVNSAIRELDLVDNADIKVRSHKEKDKVRKLDLVDNPRRKSKKIDYDVDYFGDLDFDDVGAKPSKRNKSDSPIIGDLDYDDKGAEVSHKESPFGDAIGKLDYDDNIDTSKLMTSMEDVYAGLTSDDPEVVKALIKRYAEYIDNDKEIKEAMLAQAIKLNLNCLKVICGDMIVRLTAQEKSSGLVNKEEVKALLNKLKAIAKTLTGANNTFGLIPNAIVSCDLNNQTKCINIVDYLHTKYKLPIIPIYFRGAMTKKCYKLADFLLSELPAGCLDRDVMLGSKGLLARIKNHNKIPTDLLKEIIEKSIPSGGKLKGVNTQILGDLLIICSNNNATNAAKYILKEVGKDSAKGQMVLDYIDDESASAIQWLENL